MLTNMLKFSRIVRMEPDFAHCHLILLLLLLSLHESSQQFALANTPCFSSVSTINNKNNIFFSVKWLIWQFSEFQFCFKMHSMENWSKYMEMVGKWDKKKSIWYRVIIAHLTKCSSFCLLSIFIFIFLSHKLHSSRWTWELLFWYYTLL